MEKEEKNNKEAPNKIPTQNGVIISVYVESPKTQSPQRTVADVKKTKPKKSVSKKPQAARKRGYDRRAHLLAYARDLRNAGPQEVQRPRNNMRSMPKVIKFFQYSKMRVHACMHLPDCNALSRKNGNGWWNQRVSAFSRTRRSSAPVADGDMSSCQ